MTLVSNEMEVRRFLNTIALEYEHDEVGILLLTARKKYYPKLSHSQEVVDRKLLRTSDIDRIVQKITQLSTVSGLYDDRGVHIPDVAFAPYLLLDPRSTIKAYMLFQGEINKWIYDSIVNNNETDNLKRMDIKLFSSIHKSRSRKLFYIVDIDEKNPDTLERIREMLEGLVVWTSETHGGYHVIVRRNKESGKTIYENIKDKFEKVEILKDPMTAIPGTLQGGFEVKEI